MDIIFAKTDPSSATELVKIPSGQLYLVRPGNIRSSRECMCVNSSSCYLRSTLNLLFRYNDAMATVRKAPSVEYNYQLVITRVFEEGEEDILEEEDESAWNRRAPLHTVS